MLTETERRILEHLSKVEMIDDLQLSSSLELPRSTVMSTIESLKLKGLVNIEEIVKSYYEVTEEGERRLREGMPEDRLLKMGRVEIPKAKERLGADFELAVGWAKKKGWIRVENGVIVPTVNTPMSSEILELKKIKADPDYAPDPDIVKTLQLRNLVRRKVVKRLIIRITSRGIKALEDSKSFNYVGNLTRELVISLRNSGGSVVLKEKNVEAEPPELTLGRKHFFREFLNEVRETLLEMGFNEVYSGYVEMEFYNFDMLFQPQDHPAREIHDSFSVEGFGEIRDKELLDRVAKVHKDKWKYEWEPGVARRLMLRSQTTATTSRILSTKPLPPARYFTIGKVFRPDSLDATHLLEFHQLDGLVLESDYNFRRLLGTLKEIFKRLGVAEVRFKPAYFPFTEPSVEVYGFIPQLGWVEMAGAGLLRPEVVQPTGVEGRAGAWGIGLDRLAMLKYGLSDIRDLYSNRVDFLRKMRVEL